MLLVALLGAGLVLALLLHVAYGRRSSLRRMGWDQAAQQRVASEAELAGESTKWDARYGQGHNAF